MILVTTPGKVGREAATLLAGAGAPVRLLTRRPDDGDLPRSADLEIAHGDLDDRSAVEAAVDGVDTVVLVSPAVPAQELRVVEAAARAGVGHIVKVTSKASPDSPIARRRGQSEIEAGLAASGVPHTLLRANAYMQNILMLAPVIAATGGFASSAADGRVGLVDARDVAAVAAQIALDPAGHAGRTYWITGPQLLSYGDVAGILSDVLGRTITFSARGADEDEQAMIAAGVPAPIAAQNAQAFSLIASGDAAWLSDDIESVLGRPGRGFAEFACDQAAAFAPAGDALAGGA